jgi:hypothetical protein
VAGVTAPSASERFIESVGPIVVKEVRQGLRAKVFAIFFGTLLVVCLSMALVAVAQASESAGTAFGKDFFGGYLTALGAVTFFVIPFVAFRSMVRELEDETWVLLTLTGLGSISIVRGKWISAMSQALLFGSACAPFVLFSYFLNGIDILQVITALVLATGWSAFSTSVALALATQAHTRLGRTIAHFVVLALLGMGTMGGIAFAWVIAEEGSRLVTNDAFRNVCIALGVFSWGLTWLMLEGGAAGLALPSEAASRGPRVAYAIVGLLVLAYGMIVFAIQKGSAKDAMAGQVITSFFFTLAGAFCISEADGWPRQAATGGWLKPGVARSFWLALGMLVLSAAMWGFLYLERASSGSANISNKAFRGLIAAFAYPALYLSLGVLVGRLTPLRRLGEPVATRVGFLLSVAFGVTASMVLALVFEGRPAGKVMNALNPVVGLVNFIDSGSSSLSASLVLLSAAALLAVFLAGVVLHGRDEVRSV